MTSQPRDQEKLILAAGSKVVRRLELLTYQALTSATPVATGFARASLTPAVGSPVSKQLDRPATDEAARKDASSRLSDNKARAAAIAATYKLGDGKVFLTYRAPYVVFLNEGSSSQAPKKFVERAIATSVRALGSLRFS